jgi:hypothetical protein
MAALSLQAFSLRVLFHTVLNKMCYGQSVRRNYKVT